MKQTLSTSQIADKFREYKNGGYSYAGARALAEYLESYEEETGEEMELDVVAISCDYTEYGSYEEINEELSLVDFEADFPDEDLGDNEKDEKIKTELKKNTIVIEFSGGIIIQNY